MMKNSVVKNIALIAASFSLTACSGFFEKDNTPTPTPLTSYRQQVSPRLMWSSKVGKGAGSGDYLKMSPAISASSIYTASTNGTITSLNKLTGRKNWQMDYGLTLSAGPSAGEGIVVVGTQNGVIMALRETDGKQLWRAAVPGEVIAPPAIGGGLVIAKAVDGSTRAFSIQDGRQIWAYSQPEPNLLLRGSSAPLIRHHEVIAGYANGNIVKLGLNDGQLLWQQSAAIPEGAFAIQRMIDIDADPIVYQYRIYVATYQGRISALDWASGRILWSHDISSYTGMAADNNAVYLTDANGSVWSFGADNGLVNWRQQWLRYRVLSAPASMGNYVVVGDAEGYLHWLNKADGRFAGRVSPGSAIYAAPIAENNVLYALTNTGYLAAYTLR